jgi:hypothetical protein
VHRAGALPQLLQAGKSAGVNFVSVDSFVREKYGMAASDVITHIASNCPTYTGTGADTSSSSSSGGGGGGGGGNGGGRRGGPGNPAGPGGGPGGAGPGGPGGLN